MRTWFLLVAILTISVSETHAAEREAVCAKYRAEYGWSNGYKVEATILKGHELNQATRTINYTSYSTYVVIFWDKDQASIIEMDFPYLGPVGQEGKDQRGIKWEIAKTNICY